MTRKIKKLEDVVPCLMTRSLVVQLLNLYADAGTLFTLNPGYRIMSSSCCSRRLPIHGPCCAHIYSMPSSIVSKGDQELLSGFCCILDPNCYMLFNSFSSISHIPSLFSSSLQSSNKGTDNSKSNKSVDNDAAQSNSSSEEDLDRLPQCFLQKNTKSQQEQWFLQKSYER